MWGFGPATAVLWCYFQSISMEVVRVGNNCVVFLGLPLLFCGGSSSRIGAGSFHCGKFSEGFWRMNEEMRRTSDFLDSVGCL